MAGSRAGWLERLREVSLTAEPPFSGSSLYLLSRVLWGESIRFAEPLTPHLHAVASYSLEPEEAAVDLYIAPMPVEEDARAIADWRETLGRVSKLLPTISAVASVEAVRDELLSYHITLSSPVERQAEAVLLVSLVRGIAGLEPVRSLDEARALLSIDKTRIPRMGMIYEVLIAVLQLALFEADEGGLCPPGHFTLANIVDVLGVPKSTAYRLLEDMVGLRLLRHLSSGACRGYAPSLEYEPVLGDLMLAASKTSREVVWALLYRATGKRWDRLSWESRGQ